ncbi:putative cathepsin H [Helianthus annuus]|nr:putative cathepsin H [Helianthus annuus]
MPKLFKLCASSISRKNNKKAKSDDFRKCDLLSPVQDQGSGPFCWAFGPLASVEAGYKLITGKVIKFSEQEVVDQHWLVANILQKFMIQRIGWFPTQTFDYLATKRKISLASDYPYTGILGSPKSVDDAKRVDPLVHGYLQVCTSFQSLQFYYNYLNLNVC